MAEQAESRKGKPTEKMVAAAAAAATRHGVDLPKQYDQDFDVCKAFLDQYLSKPSPKALSFAEKISKDKGVALSDEVKSSSKALSAWIDENK